MEDIRNSKYFQYLYDNYEALSKDHQAFSKRMHELIYVNTDEMATVLKCHLIVENFIDQLLEVGYPTIDWKKANLNFSKKLELTNSRGTAIGTVYYPAIKKLNTIRNKFAHQITYELQESDYSEIKIAMDLWNKLFDKPCSTGLAVIEEFTIWVCSNIETLINGIKKETPTTGLAGYQEWLREMTNTPKD